MTVYIGEQVETVELTSQAGCVYACRVWCPPQTKTDALLPVIYVLDGQDFFYTVVETLARLSRRTDATGVVPATVVGVSRQTQARVASRHVDFTPDHAADGSSEGRQVGGADAFLHFLTAELAPIIEQRFPVNPQKRVLFGHSLAGFFTLYSLVTAPTNFAAYIAISPSVWWHEALLVDEIAQRDSVTSTVFLAAGEWEGELPPYQRDSERADAIRQKRRERDMLGRLERVANKLTGLLGRKLHYQVFPQEDHASVVLVALPRALRTLRDL